jgi:hypothetical protein
MMPGRSGLIPVHHTTIKMRANRMRHSNVLIRRHLQIKVMLRDHQIARCAMGPCQLESPGKVKISWEEMTCTAAKPLWGSFTHYARFMSASFLKHFINGCATRRVNRFPWLGSSGKAKR